MNRRIPFALATILALAASCGFSLGEGDTALEGIIEDPVGRILSGATVVMTCPAIDDQRAREAAKARKGKKKRGQKPEAPPEEVEEWNLQALSDEGGAFRFSIEDPKHPYNLYVRMEGFEEFATVIEPEQGKVTRLSFVLRPTGVEQADPLAREAYNRGLKAAKGGDRPGAVLAFREALERNPGHAKAALELADLLEKDGNHQEAMEVAEELLLLRPNDEFGMGILFRSAREVGDDETTIRAAEGLANTRTGRSLAAKMNNLGAEFVNRRDLESARDAYILAVILQDDLVPALNNLAAIRYAYGEYTESLALVDRSLQLEPGELNGLATRYMSLCRLHMREPADEAFQVLRDASDKQAVASAARVAASLFKNDDVFAAAAAFEDVLKVDPDHTGAHRELGLAYANLGEIDKSKMHLERFLELAPDDPSAATVRAMIDSLR